MGRSAFVAAVFSVVALSGAPGCGLTLDYDPPTDGGIDARMDAASAPDASRDGGTADGGAMPECRTTADCDDGDACNGAELCESGACVAGEPITCDDRDACNGLETCLDGECIAGEPPLCPLDTDFCNGIEGCDPELGCVAGTPVDCDDGISCTHDVCTGDGSCIHEADSSLCTDGPGGRCTDTDCQYDFCDATTCRPGPCETATCSGALCMRTSLCDPAGEQCCAGACVPRGCDDGNPCTSDACGTDGCQNPPRDGATSCDDDPCSVGDRCSGGVCVSGSIPACADGNPCTNDLCDPTSGICSSVPADGRACSDGDACTAGDRCSGGSCTAGSGVTFCMPPSPCIDSTCDPSLGCVDSRLPPGSPCGAGRTCTDLGTCECMPGTSDCDFDGSCECDGRCGAGGGCVFGCTNDGECGVGETCCVPTGTCIDPACLSCCMFPVDSGRFDGGPGASVDAGRDGGSATSFDAGRDGGFTTGGTVDAP